MRILKKLRLILIIIVLAGFVMPQRFRMPVEKAGKQDYHQKSFWYYPWGKSVTHKGVDIFASKGRNIFSSTDGIILYRGELPRGGKVILVLGPKWRLHYYAHLNEIDMERGIFVKSGSRIGSVGDTGNAAGKPPHLHYSIVTAFPYLWRADKSRQGWKKIFYLDPIFYINKSLESKNG